MKKIELKHLKVLRLQPGDTLVMTVDRNMTEQQREKLSDQVKLNFAGCKVIVLEQGIRFGVMRKESLEPAKAWPTPPPRPPMTNQYNRPLRSNNLDTTA